MKSHRSRAPLWLTIAVASLLVLCVATLAGIFWAFDRAARPDAILELWKTVLNLTLLVVVGGLVSLLLKRIESHRNTERAIHRFRMDYLARLRSAYRATKTVRRGLRVAGATTARRDELRQLTAFHVAAYREQMEVLNDAELDFEDLETELASTPDAFAAGNELIELVGSTRKYLRRVLKEYEDHFHRLNGQDGGFTAFESLQHLADFSGPRERADGTRSGYDSILMAGRKRAIELIQADLLPIRLAQGHHHD